MSRFVHNVLAVFHARGRSPSSHRGGRPRCLPTLRGSQQLATRLPWQAVRGLQSGLAGLCATFTSAVSVLADDSRIFPSADFEVKDSLPNVTWTLPRSFAGNIPVNRAGHPNNTLYFWGFEKENGSLTAGANERANEPWGIWLNGGSARHRSCQSGVRRSKDTYPRSAQARFI